MNWDQFDKEIRELGRKIDFSPDVVIGVVRGGVVPAAVLARMLKVRDIRVVKVRHVGSGRKVDDEAPEVSGMKVLLVEDMLETGKSLQTAKEYFESKGAEVKTACIYTMKKSTVTPDYSLREIPEVVPFPWE